MTLTEALALNEGDIVKFRCGYMDVYQGYGDVKEVWMNRIILRNVVDNCFEPPAKQNGYNALIGAYSCEIDKADLWYRRPGSVYRDWRYHQEPPVYDSWLHGVPVHQLIPIEGEPNFYRNRETWDTYVSEDEKW